MDLVALTFAAGALAQAPQERPDWKLFFSDQAVDGTIVIADERSGEMLAYDVERAQKRFMPASTFKVPHALFALDAGAVRDEFQVIRWDGVKRDFDGWNQDQTLRSSMRHSTVWVYQEFAVRSVRCAKRYLTRIQYGNADPSGGVDRFWLDGALGFQPWNRWISCENCIRNELPFRVEHQRLVKDIMIVEAGRDWILRAKTGWQARVEPQIGWWVGWVETPTGAVIFALNIDLPGGMKDAPKREAIVRSILQSIGALPR